MRFDFTPEVVLDERNSKIYAALRPALFSGAFLAGLYIASLVLFPSQYFSFDFLNANSSKNTLLNPQADGSALDHGRFPEQKPVSFFAPVTEKYSSVEISFTLSQKSAPLTSGQVSLKRSFQAFFYPEGETLGPKGESLFPVSEEKIGFADGSLISSPDSIFIVSNGKILPIDSEVTFLSSGFRWEDVIQAGSDELSLYEKGKLFTLASPHPDGTVFSATDEKSWYLIKDGRKLKLPSENIMRSWTKLTPIDASAQGLETSVACQLQKDFWSRRSYSCRIPLENLQNLPGKDFRFETTSDSEIKVNTISARFIRDMNYTNFLFSASTFLNRIKNHYASPQ